MKKILVVDDDKDILEIVKFILKRSGFDVFTYPTGLNVQEIVKQYNPNLILLDVRLPGGKLGTQICAELKQETSIPIILFSAEQSISYKNYNADAFLKKPFEMQDLISIINQNIA